MRKYKTTALYIMGANKGGNFIYYNVANGKLVRTFKEANKNTVSRTNKANNIVHEEFFKDYTGMLTDVSTKDGKFGKELIISFRDGEEESQIQLQFSSRYSSSFLKALPNINLSKEVRLMPWQMPDSKDAAKTVSGITLYQGGKIAPAFTKEDPNGLPEMEKIQQKIKGKMTTTWDDTAMMEFLEAKAMDLFKSKLTGKKETPEKEQEPDLDEVFGTKGFKPIEEEGKF